MPHDRYYHPGPLTETLTLTGSEHHHLFKVMRASAGHTVELIDGHGTLATAIIDAIDKKTATLTIHKTHKEPPPPTRSLIQSYIKQPKLELVCEKCTELGITEFHFFPAARSERDHLSENHQNRLHQLVLVATKQCGRLHIPTIHLHSELPPLDHAAYATLKGNPPLLHTTQCTSAIIGPESGWSKDEEQTLAEKATPVSLHHLTLRAETAAIAASYALFACVK